MKGNRKIWPMWEGKKMYQWIRTVPELAKIFELAENIKTVVLTVSYIFKS